MVIFLRVKQSFEREGSEDETKLPSMSAPDHVPVAQNGVRQSTNLSALVEVDQINVIYLILLATGAVAVVHKSTQRMLTSLKQKA